MTRYREVNRRDWKKAAAALALFVAILSAGALLLLPAYWYVWAAIVVIGLVLLVSWRAGNYGWRCARCGHEFEISPGTDFISPHGVSRDGRAWKLLRCPRCGERTKAEAVAKA